MVETIIFLLLIVVFVMLLIFKGDTTKTLQLLQFQLSDIEKKLDALRKEDNTKPADAPAPAIPPIVTVPRREPPPAQPERERIIQPQMGIPVVPETPKEPLQETGPVLRDVPAEQVIAGAAEVTTPPMAATSGTQAIPPRATPQPKPGFWERNPDIEKFIGENLFNKIGIGVLVLGIGFFLKYAIDKNWINEAGRTLIGFICGAILLGLSYRLRKTFAAFSSVLVGGGVSVLYFTVTIAFQQYHLFSQSLAFALTILITALTVWLSLSYDRRELAVIAILGGFGAPFMVSTGEGNAVVLFTYIAILNMGMLVLAYFKKWNIVNIISYIATVILYGGWLSYHLESNSKAPYGVALVYGTLYYLIFFAMNVLNNVRNNKPFGFGDIIILLSNTFLYYVAGIVILQQTSGNTWHGLFTAMMAVFNGIFALVLYRNKKADRLLIYLLTGLTITFVSLTAPVQLHGNYITLFWATETVLLMWLWQKSGIRMMQYAAILVLILMFFSLLMDWQQLYYTQHPHIIPLANKGFVTGVVAVAAVGLLLMLSKREKPEALFLIDIPMPAYRTFLLVLVCLMVYAVGILELLYQSNYYFEALTITLSGIYNYLFLIALLLTGRRRKWTSPALLLLPVIGALAYLFFYNPDMADVRNDVVDNQHPVVYFYLHYLLMTALCVMVWQTWRLLQQLKQPGLKPVFQWSAAILVLFIISAELDHLLVFIAHHPASTPAILYDSHRVGYAILWSTYAFVLIFLGLRRKSKLVRIISIAVFGLTIGKLFLYDFSGLGAGGKIAAFISLGVILLVISFMYQRLKKIFFADDQPGSHNEDKS